MLDMEFFEIQLPIILLSFAGVLVGRFLGKFVREEVEPGRRYFMLLRYVILTVIVVSMVYYMEFVNIVVFLLSVAVFVGGFLVARLIRLRYFYLGLAVLSGLLVSEEFLIFIASMVFLYGLAYGTLLLDKGVGRKLLVNFALFMVPVLLPLLFFLLLEIRGLGLVSLSSLQYLLAFTAGSLFLRH